MWVTLDIIPVVLHCMKIWSWKWSYFVCVFTVG